MTESLAGGGAAAPLSMRAAASLTSAAVRAARQLLTDLERGRRIDAAVLRSAMEAAFGASDAAGVWNWKTAYDVCEAATVLFLRKFGPAMRAKTGSTAAMLPMLARVASLLPTHTRRSEDSQALQQFSTPIPLGLAACTAAGITPSDRVLEPSAGTGLLAILAELAGGTLMLNELAEGRASLLDHLFTNVKVTRFDAAQIDDHLDASVVPSVVLMNPPFSALANVDRRMADAAFRHIASALARLCDGGRLVAIVGENLATNNPAWTDAFVRLQERGRVVFSAAIDGAVYAKHGTQTNTRLLVIDKLPAADPKVFPASPGMASDVVTLFDWVIQHVPPRMPVATPAVVDVIRRPPISRSVGASAPRPSSTSSGAAPEAVELAYETVDWSPAEGARLTDALYEEYGLQSIRIPGSCAHPTKLVQSAAMATAQVTENVFDTPTGRFLLVPQGARLIGIYDSQVTFGQSRVLLVWTRLIMPNGRSIVLERQPGTDAAGYAGLEDQVDNHWGELFKAAALSTFLAVGSELGAGSDTNSNDSAIIQALRHGASDSLSQTGQQVVRRSLNIQPTLTVRPGFPVRVVVNRDLILAPYGG